MWPFRRRNPLKKLEKARRRGKHRQRAYDRMCTFPGCEKKKNHRGPHGNRGNW